MDIKLDMVVPGFARSILLLGKIPDSIRNFYPAGLEKVWNAPLNAAVSEQDFFGEKLDCLLVGMPETDEKQIVSVLDKAAALADLNGQVVFIFDSRNGAPLPQEKSEALLASRGWLVYHFGTLAVENTRSTYWILITVRAGYNPVTHARRMTIEGRPDCAIAILNAIPIDLITEKTLAIRLALEKQHHIFRWQQLRKGKEQKHEFFSKARREFAVITALEPLLSESYRLHASYWTFMGRNDMASRVLRSIQFVLPEQASRQQLDGLEKEKDCSEKTGSFNYEEKPEASVWTPRILIITHDHSDYGMDCLYHGLCSHIGQQNVVEFPWKPTLHGQNKAAAVNYPCFFNYPGKPRSVSQLIEDLKEGRFDFILFGDVVQMAYPDEVRRLCSAVPDLPVILYDTWDDCYTPMKRLLNYIGRDRFDLIFKREMLAGLDYGDGVFPLPFGYPQDQLPKNASTGQKKNPVFWAGKTEFGLRPLYITALEKKLNQTMKKRFDQEVYQAKLRESLIGLSFFGCGFDTVRYWELPANRVMLMAERPPIHIPFDFTDGQSAVFFDDLPDMLDKLEYYLNKPDETASIAVAGHEHYLRYHTTTARAEQFLRRVRQQLQSAPVI